MLEIEVDNKKKSKKKKGHHSKHGKKKHSKSDKQQSTPAENERVQTHMGQGDSDLMAAAIQ